MGNPNRKFARFVKYNLLFDPERIRDRIVLCRQNLGEIQRASDWKPKYNFSCEFSVAQRFISRVSIFPKKKPRIPVFRGISIVIQSHPRACYLREPRIGYKVMLTELICTIRTTWAQPSTTWHSPGRWQSRDSSSTCSELEPVPVV